MKSSWKNSEAKKYLKDPVDLRVYTSRLLGKEPSLVLHGGGNTSVKVMETNVYGEAEELLYIKGSGWDLATIKREGFAPVKLRTLKKMAEFKALSDSDMVKLQRAAMTDPGAPTPSVEAILHAVIPYKFVDHTHADSIVTITNTPNGEKRIRDIFGDRLLIVPYVMPGFILAKKIFEMTRGINWQKYDGMILMHHGVFTFHDNAKTSYQRMIEIVSKAEKYIHKRSKVKKIKSAAVKLDLLSLAKLRKSVSDLKGSAVLAHSNITPQALAYAELPNISKIATRGPLTPDHVIRTKPVPAVIANDPQKEIQNYAQKYRAYFNRYKTNGLMSLDAAPRFAVWKNKGIVSFASTIGELKILNDIIKHTIKAIREAEGLGGWKALPAKDIFDVEYWSLEQAKLKKKGSGPFFQGRVALVTGAASGIGKACVLSLQKKGATVVAIDINGQVTSMFDSPQILGLKADVTKPRDLKICIETTVKEFGGLDILVSNAGIFPAGEVIANLKETTWDRSLQMNLTSHQRLLKECIPYLSLGIDPAVVFIASKNVPAPGPGAAAYSAAKAGLTQLGRIAALELAPLGIRVNMVHPNQVFDTAIWTKEVLANRAAYYHMTVDEYKRNNLLKVKITSDDVAELVCCMAGPVFAKTTGAQVPIDGGNERVI